MSTYSSIKTGRRIRDARKSLGLSQEEAAALLGITQSKLSRLENGQGTHDLYILHEISVGFNKPLEWLVFGIGETEENSMEKEETNEIKAVKNGRVEVVNPEGELTGSVLRELRRNGYSVRYIFPSSLKECADPQKEALRMARMILERPENENAFWGQAEVSLLAFLLLYVATSKDERTFEEILTELIDEDKRRDMYATLSPELRGMFNCVFLHREATQIVLLVLLNIRGISVEM